MYNHCYVQLFKVHQILLRFQSDRLLFLSTIYIDFHLLKTDASTFHHHLYLGAALHLLVISFRSKGEGYRNLLGCVLQYAHHNGIW